MSSSTRSLLVATLLAGATLAARAQNVAFTADKIPNKEALKVAQKSLKNGEDSYTASPARYAVALPYFLEAQKINASNAALNLRIGDCYLHLGDKATALPYLQKAVSLEAGPAPRTHYVLGRAYHLNARWAEALREYEKARPQPTATATKKGQPTDASATDVARRIAECQVGQQLMKHPVRVFIDTLGRGINSAEDDYSPVIAADESMLFFTSRRAGTTGNGKAAEGSGYADDVYQGRWDATGKRWLGAATLGSPLNTNGSDVTVALAPDGQRLLLHADDNSGDLSETHLAGGSWSKPRPLGSHINSKHRETSATYSPDGRYVYFVSDKPEGSLGGSDIYRAEIDGKAPAQNLGPVINSPYGEEGVFMQPDGKTLYFSSEGHGTMGGYDIFKSVYQDGKWSEPENLGWPINTPDDDVFFVASASGRYGYYSSVRPGGKGGKDIYRITFLGTEKQVAVRQEERLLASKPVATRQPLPDMKVPTATAEVTVLRGTVTDAATRQPVQAQLEVLNDATGQVISSFQTLPNGKYLVSLPSGTNYGLVLKNEAYLFHSENVNLPPSAGYTEATRDVKLQKMEPGSNIVLNNVFFDPGKAALRPESTAEMERLLKLLADNSRLKLNICGHTDNVGPVDANLELSKQRTQAVLNYLIEHKIKAERLQATGYGATIPIASNATEAGRRLNQRIEFKVLSR